ncbi:MAG TPA: penicillin-binding transpeptidase domain-containing protein, partial [Thermoanaerobaculia bacterium]|nr:penicillin-binding transpeptidase domain-containing protein [Thermoanaerobaculia bacterium]
PHVVRMVEHANPDGTTQRLRVATQALRHEKLAPEVIDHVHNGLWKVVNEEGGTGGNSRINGLDIAGKTGTVQVIAQSGWFTTAGMPFMSRDHAWFASYAPSGNPQMVVVVFVEHAGAHGGTDAAPLAKLLYQSAFSQEVAAHLDLTDPELLRKIKEGQIPVPGQEPKQQAQPIDSSLGH